MSTNQTGIDLAKVRTIQNCLLQRFHDLYIGGEFLTLFVFTDGTQSGQLKFNPKYLDACDFIGTLQMFMATVVMPAILANPDMRIEVKADGAITITEKYSEY